jgi:3-deoxy-D-manno-octulosonate 8-phosphate phosphatase (KDO 8-P phosphatase)
MVLEENLKGLCSKFGVDYVGFLSDLGVENPHELTVFDLRAISEEYEVDLYALLFKPLFSLTHLQAKLDNIRLLVLDVDGVMTDGGMYFTENGDQFKKFNTKDGMAVLHLTKNNFQVAIISSGFVSNAIQKRAEMLGIQHCVVTRESKLDVLKRITKELQLELNQVAIVGDDINDLEVMKNVGIAACPKDAVQEVKQYAHIILQTDGGKGCVREFIDMYLTKK